MKTFISIVIIFFGVVMSGSFSSTKEKNSHSGGRCTGSSTCSACSNCSGCTHCAGGGGSCGVCGGGSYKKKSVSRSSSNHKRSKNTTTSPVYLTKKSKTSKPPKIRIDEVNINANSRPTTEISIIKIYEKPSLQSRVIEKVPENAKLLPVSKQKYWQKVKVQKSGKTGYVYYKNAK